MMAFDAEPLDAASAAALVARVKQDLDHRDERGGDVLLSDLLCAAWPSRRCQDQ
jgi:hypothetical protein